MKAIVQDILEYGGGARFHTIYTIQGDDIRFEDGFIKVFNKSKKNGMYYNTPDEVYKLEHGDRVLMEREE